MRNILSIDDEEVIGDVIIRILPKKDGFNVTTAMTGKEALQKFDDSIDLILLDINLPDINGIELLRTMRRKSPQVPVLMMTGQSSVDLAVIAMKEGAADFIEKPFRSSELRKTVNDVLKTRNVLKQENFGIIGGSSKIKQTMKLIEKFARSDISVLLQGETGSGKELFARAIHASSERRDGPFIPLDCATLSENLFESELFGHEKGSFTGSTGQKIGKFERADAGTLFIDEVENLTPTTQAKLLRVIQEKVIERVGGSEPIKVDVRIVAAANTDLMNLVRRGKFRSDLYYRFSQAVIAIPPLRERKEDITELTQHFFNSYASDYCEEGGISDEALDVLKSYNWPGNVRELENVIRSAAILGDGSIETVHLPQYLTLCQFASAPPDDSAAFPSNMFDFNKVVSRGFEDGSLNIKAVAREWSETLEIELIRRVREQSQMKMGELARFLYLDPKTLRSRIKKTRS